MKRLLTSAFCFLSLWLSSVASAQSSISISAPSFPPFVSSQHDSQCSGVIEDIIEQLAHDTGIELNLVRMPYARIVRRLHYGVLEAALIFKNEQLLSASQKLESLDYIGPLSHSEVVIISEREILNYEELYTIGAIATIRKANFDSRFDSDSHIQKAYVESYVQGLRMFNSGRAAAVIGSKTGLAHALQQLQMPEEALLYAYYLSKKEWGIHLVKGSLSSQQREQLTQQVKAMYQTDLVYQRYLNKRQAQAHCFK